MALCVSLLQNTDYDFRSGIKKKEEEFDTSSTEATGLDGRVQEKLDAIYKVGGHAAEEARHDAKTNAISKLERDQDDKRRAATESERFESLLEVGEIQRHYDYDANAALRQSMRGKRRAAEALEKEQDEKGFLVPLLPHTEEEKADATALFSAARATAPSSVRDAAFRSNERRRRLEVTTASIFGKSSLDHQRDLKPAVIASKTQALRDSAIALAREEQRKREQETAAPDALNPLGNVRKRPRTTKAKTTTKRLSLTSNSTSPGAGSAPSARLRTAGADAEAVPANAGSRSGSDALLSLASNYDSDSE